MDTAENTLGAAMDGRWFYLEAETSIGPYSWGRLDDLFKAGLIGPSTYVWREGDPAWITLATARAARQTSPVPPLPSSAPLQPFEAGEPRGGPSVAAQPWLEQPVAPWRRYGARMLDTTINGYIGMFAVGVVWYTVAPASADAFFNVFSTPTGVLLDIIMTLIIAGLVGGLLIGTTGSTVGKAIFGVKVVQPNEERPIGVPAALRREASVYLFGLGFGIPLVALITMIASYNRLKTEGTTKWDARRHRILYRPEGAFQTVMNIVGAVLVVLVIIVNRMLLAQQ